VCGVILIWLGLLGVLEGEGFTTISQLPLDVATDPALFAYIAQIILGATLFLARIEKIGKGIAALYAILIVYNFIIAWSAQFDPQFPQLSTAGVNSLLELFIAFGAFGIMYSYYNFRS
jgi:hypothetical protein